MNEPALFVRKQNQMFLKAKPKPKVVPRGIGYSEQKEIDNNDSYYSPKSSLIIKTVHEMKDMLSRRVNEPKINYHSD